jgi:hypothetical protein
MLQVAPVGRHAVRPKIARRGSDNHQKMLPHQDTCDGDENPRGELACGLANTTVSPAVVL